MNVCQFPFELYTVWYMQEMSSAPEPVQPQPGDHRQAAQEWKILLYQFYWLVEYMCSGLNHKHSDGFSFETFMQESKPLLCGIASIDGSLEASNCFIIDYWWFHELFHFTYQLGPYTSHSQDQVRSMCTADPEDDADLVKAQAKVTDCIYGNRLPGHNTILCCYSYNIYDVGNY